jgi:hypothetical protein
MCQEEEDGTGASMAGSWGGVREVELQAQAPTRRRVEDLAPTTF